MLISELKRVPVLFLYMLISELKRVVQLVVWFVKYLSKLRTNKLRKSIEIWCSVLFSAARKCTLIKAYDRLTGFLFALNCLLIRTSCDLHAQAE